VFEKAFYTQKLFQGKVFWKIPLENILNNQQVDTEKISPGVNPHCYT